MLNLISRRQFKPSLVLTILALLAFMLLIKLGFWQLERANEKQAIEQAYAQNPSLPLLIEGDLERIPREQLAFRRIRLIGTFDNKHQFLLDNQHLDHRIGFRVLTPFIIAKSEKLVLIDRGFIQKVGNNTATLKPIDGLQTIETLVEPPIKKNFLLGQIQQTKNWPMVIEAIEFPFIQGQLQKKVIPIVLKLDDRNANSFEHVKQVVQISHQKHIAYAVQWFLLAAILLIVFVVVSFKKGKNE